MSQEVLLRFKVKTLLISKDNRSMNSSMLWLNNKKLNKIKPKKTMILKEMLKNILSSQNFKLVMLKEESKLILKLGKISMFKNKLRG